MKKSLSIVLIILFVVALASLLAKKGASSSEDVVDVLPKTSLSFSGFELGCPIIDGVAAAKNNSLISSMEERNDGDISMVSFRTSKAHII